jgi:radical SAM protein with 4Fe4S-binding SPASM domain
VGPGGTFRPCNSLRHPDTIYDLRKGTLREAWDEWVPRVRDLRGTNLELLEKCRECDIINLCLWCPAHAALETGAMDDWVEYVCEVAHARAAALRFGEDCEQRTTRRTHSASRSFAISAMEVSRTAGLSARSCMR